MSYLEEKDNEYTMETMKKIHIVLSIFENL